MSLFDDLPEPSYAKVSNNEVQQSQITMKRKPITIEKSDIINKKSKFDIIAFKSFSSARKGERDEMQDEHILIDNFIDYMTKNLNLNLISNDVSQCAFFGVYDGHSGNRASKFACENVHRYLASIFPKGNCDSIENDIKKMFTYVYKQIDRDFLKIAVQQRPHLRDGSTAVNILVVDNTMYVAHIGDSKAVLARQLTDDSSSHLTAISLTKDHTAIDYDERLRIQKHGSVVRDGRVNGLLEVSRSFGDFQYKSHGVISVPEVKKCKITQSDKFVILACDGLWRSFSPQEAVEFVNNIVESHGELSLTQRYEMATGKLTGEAVLKKSGDNITVVIVAFHI